MDPELRTYGWWIETDRFRNAPTEERAVNPGRYGEGLATFVAERLASRGWTVASIGPEDWGWLVELAAEGRTLRVTCGNEDGSVVRWCVGPVARGSFLERLRGRAPTPALLARIDEDLRESFEADPQTTWIGREQPSHPAPDDTEER